jgi:transcriptional regulator with XRE-family HTH domain
VPPPTTAQLGIAIREAREAKGLSIETLAAKAGISWRYLSQLEGTGKKQSNPTWKVLAALAENLGLEVSDLARRAEAIPRRKSP